MKNIKNTTQKGIGFINAYDHANNTGELYQVYGSYSSAKINALDHCKSILKDMDGFSPRIIGSNSSFFTYAFQFIDKITGVIELAVITAANSYCIDYI